MKIKDFSNLNLNDLKGLDPRKIPEILRDRPDILISIVLIVLTIYGIGHIFTYHKIKSANLSNEFNKNKEKLKIMEEYSKLQPQYEEIKKKFPQTVPSDQLIAKLSEFAVAHNVQTLLLSPAQRKNDQYTEITWVNINISSDNYDDIVEFIKDIENSPYAIRIEKWSGNMKETENFMADTSLAKNDESKKDIIEANIQIGSVGLIDE